jgi:AcrR family transcriptional regulator
VSKVKNNQQKLLEAGLAILCEKSPEEVSMDELAARAGVTKPMVYYYFGSKVGFYQKLVKHIEDSLRTMVDKCLFPGISFREALKNMISLRMEQTIRQPEISNSIRIMAMSKSICGAESRAKIVGLFERLEPVFQEALKKGEIRPDADLHLTMGMMNSLIDGALRIKGIEFFKQVNPDDFAEKTVRMIFDGIGYGERVHDE